MKLKLLLSAAACWLETSDHLKCLMTLDACLDLKPSYTSLEEIAYLEKEAHAMQYLEDEPLPRISRRAFIKQKRRTSSL